MSEKHVDVVLTMVPKIYLTEQSYILANLACHQKLTSIQLDTILSLIVNIDKNCQGYALGNLARYQKLSGVQIDTILSLANNMDNGIKCYTLRNLAQYQKLSSTQIDTILSLVNNVNDDLKICVLNNLAKDQKLSEAEVNTILCLAKQVKPNKTIKNYVPQNLIEKQVLTESQISQIFSMIKLIQDLPIQYVALWCLMTSRQLIGQQISEVLTMVKNLKAVTEEEFKAMLKSKKAEQREYKALIQGNSLNILIMHQGKHINTEHINLILDIILTQDLEQYFRNILVKLLGREDLRNKFSEGQISKIFDAVLKFKDKSNQKLVMLNLQDNQNAAQKKIEMIESYRIKKDLNQTTSNNITQNKTNSKISDLKNLLNGLLKTEDKNSNNAPLETNKIKESEACAKQQIPFDLQTAMSLNNEFDVNTLLSFFISESFRGDIDIKENMSNDERKKTNKNLSEEKAKEEQKNSICQKNSSELTDENNSIFSESQVRNNSKESVSDKIKSLRDDNNNNDIPKTSKNVDNVYSYSNL